MDLAVLPGPSLAELARTAVARATAACVACGSQPPGNWRPPAGVAMRADPAGQLVLLPAPGSALASRLAARPHVTVCVSAEPPFSALRLTGRARPGPDSAHGRAAYHVTLRSAEFTGAGGRPVPLASYLAAAPDPLWREAPAILRHLSRGHMGELVACARAHGLRQAEWVMPSGLDRFGLRLLVITPGGVADTRLSFPGGPVASFSDIPPSLRTVLACRCQAPGLRLDGHDANT